MTSTLGSTSHVSDTADATSGTTNSQIATPLTMPTAGVLTFVSVYMAGYGGSCSTKCALWNTSNSKLADSAAFTASSASFANGNSAHYNKGVDNINLTATTYRVGFLRTTSGDGFQWDKDDGSGKTTYKGDGLDGSLTSITTDSDSKPNVYITYETVPSVYIRRGGAWVKCTDIVVKRANVFVSVGPEVYVKRAGVWVKANT